MSYGEILRKLDEILDFCRYLDLEVDSSRFVLYRQQIFELDQAIIRGRKEGITPTPPEGVTDLEYIVALTESMEFGDILPYLVTCVPALIQKKLTSVLRGPFLPSDEDKNSNEARNILFELNLAARLSRAGFTPTLGEHPDLQCGIDGKRLLFECKRPFSDSKIVKRINQAENQLRSHLKRSPPGARGVIAISFSKILNPGDKLFVMENETVGRRGLEKALQAKAERYRRRWLKFYGTDIVGIMFHVITPAINKEEDKYAVGQQWNAHPLCDPGSLDYKTFQNLGDALDKAQY